MGQCSTLHSDIRENDESVAKNHSSNEQKKSNKLSCRYIGKFKEQRDSTSNSNRNDHQRDNKPQRYNECSTSTETGSSSSSENSSTPLRVSQRKSETIMMNKLRSVIKNGVTVFEPLIEKDNGSGQKKDLYQIQEHSRGYHSRKISEPTQIIPPAIESIPQPPEGAIRSRCYRLNLDAPIIPSKMQDGLGPFHYEVPLHLRTDLSTEKKANSWHSAADAMNSLKVTSSEDDASTDSRRSATQIAITTAQIFRGVTVDGNGAILSQNMRTTRTNGKGKCSKVAEQSRQTAKINKANDLIDDAVHNGKENEGIKSNMISLVVAGEYDEVNHLVKDGAKKLRDAQGQPDDVLLVLNRSRKDFSSFERIATSDHFLNSMSPSSRKRVSPHSSRFHTASTDRKANNFFSRSRSRNNSAINGTTPKLKRHPRDRPSSRRINIHEAERSVRSNELSASKCNDIFGVRDDWGDISKGFDSIWNCGAEDTNTPTNRNHVTEFSSPFQFEGRNETKTKISKNCGIAETRISQNPKIPMRIISPTNKGRGTGIQFEVRNETNTHFSRNEQERRE